jgi:hypothetical protein
VKINKYLLLTCFIISAASHASDFKKDWGYLDLVADVDDCAIFLIKSAADNYQKKAISPAASEIQLQEELMSFVRYVELGFRAQCYCANEMLYKQYSKEQIKKPSTGVDIGTLLNSEQCIRQRDEAFESLRK